MAQYICLRNCFVDDFLHYEGRTYEIPDGKPVSPKNFKPVSPEPLKVEVKTEQVKTEPTKEEGKLICPVCGRECKGEFGLKSHQRSHKGK